jgi:GGDEF domain-containing protein
MVIQNYTLIVAPSIGIAVPRSGTATARDLICQADAMMYAAKPKAKSRT